MAEHVLLKRATRRPYRDVPEIPEQASYNAALGFWTLNGEPLVRSEQFEAGLGATKKCDQETGEDRKGE
ncbi:hypothetical protein [Candidatus Methylomirabilis sp.]|uniref:hypothetical protein n=1 Tax=Candidatus Methylomirabilis sp. TaxID=2032687 RepID=UPI003C7146E9